MRDERTGSSSTSQARLPLPIEKIIAKKRLARAIEAARENGALAFLARHLKTQLKDLNARDNQVSTGQLEELIAQAASSITGR